MVKTSPPPLPKRGSPVVKAARRRWAWEWLAPLLVGIGVVLAWEGGVRLFQVSPFLLPAPSLILQTLQRDWPELSGSLWMTLVTTVQAFLVAMISGVAVAIVFTLSPWVERSFFPYAVVLQTVPIVAIVPLLLVWTKFNTPLTMLICAWIVAFFPILSNTTLGLKSVDHNLLNLFQLYGAKGWQTLLYLRLPSAMPYFLAGLRISGGLSLIGAVVAEFAAGTGGQKAGLAYQILISSYNLQVPRMFAALTLVMLLGIAIFALLGWISDLILGRWHESAVRREN
ncbi:MAG: ABC transporter permease [Thermostichales cyanobacterium SZTDM-1c_bins_54]